MQIIPKSQLNDLGDERQNRFLQELLAVYSIAEKMQISSFYKSNFKDEIHRFSIGLTVFLTE